MAVTSMSILNGLRGHDSLQKMIFLHYITVITLYQLYTKTQSVKYIYVSLIYMGLILNIF